MMLRKTTILPTDGAALADSQSFATTFGNADSDYMVCGDMLSIARHYAGIQAMKLGDAEEWRGELVCR